MGSSRFVRPDTIRLSISDGDWLLVKTQLTAGEQRKALSQMYLAGEDGRLRVNPVQVGLARITAYLLDWSFRDEHGDPVQIRGLSAAELTMILDGLSTADFKEVDDAIEAHEEAMAAARLAAKKKTATGDAPISPSPSAVAGALSGSASLT